MTHLAINSFNQLLTTFSVQTDFKRIISHLEQVSENSFSLQDEIEYAKKLVINQPNSLKDLGDEDFQHKLDTGRNVDTSTDPL